MVVIDSRLKTCDTDQDIAENFNRTLALVDAGGGSRDSSVIFVTDTEGTLNIKPSDVIDEDGNCYDKYYILKNEANGAIIFYNEISVRIDEDMIGIVFMASGVVEEPKVFTSSISGDEYFTEAETSSPEIPNIGS